MISDTRHLHGHSETDQTLAASKGSHAYAGNARRQVNGGQLAAPTENCVSHILKHTAVCECDLLQRRTGIKSLRFNERDTCRDLNFF